MPDYPILSKINSPDDLKQLNRASLRKLSSEVSKYIQEIVENVGITYICNSCIKQEYQKIFLKINPVFPVLK